MSSRLLRQIYTCSITCFGDREFQAISLWRALVAVATQDEAPLCAPTIATHLGEPTTGYEASEQRKTK
jgi:hypothetical protein